MKKITEETLKQAIAEVSATDSGQIFLAALKSQCNWDETFISSDPVQTHYYAAMRGVWAGVRKRIPKRYLKEIEFDYQIVNDVKMKGSSNE